MKVVRYPHPALVHPTKLLTSIDKKVQLHVGHMIDTMYEAKGLGLAANQVALPFQLLVMNITGDPEPAGPRGRFHQSESSSNARARMEDEEGCLSFPGLYQKVRRAKTVKVQAYNLKGELVEKVVQRPGGSCLAARDRPSQRRRCSSTRWARSPRLAAADAVKDFERRVPRGPGTRRDPGGRGDRETAGGAGNGSVN